jgi:alginate O-acetyltransferase complex protein AlgI
LLFQSQVFLLAFLPITLIVWHVLARRDAAREWMLVAFSTVFYGWWDPRFVPLLLGQMFLSWLIVEIYIRSGRTTRTLLVFGIVANLATLIFFKYWAFLAGNIVAAIGLKLPVMSVVLPIGISFFTFEIISYLIDLGWSAAPRYQLRRFALFVALFPRLIAGPIVRHHEIIPQFDLNPLRNGLEERLSKGATLLIIGLAKKVLLADALAPLADATFETATSKIPGLWFAWSGTLAFTFQLFLDFSAYSEMALGIALMLGFTLPQNFNSPYAASSLRDFWRRWHMTLSRYLRDYVYIPLGGSRKGLVGYVGATLITMGLCGLWHGAGWTFVAWGLMHGLGLMVCRFWQSRMTALPYSVAWVITFLFVVVGWVLFRAPDFSTAANVLIGMVAGGGLEGAIDKPALLTTAAIVSVIRPTSYEFVMQRLQPRPLFAVLASLVAVFVILEVGKGQPKTFIYFKF